MTKAQRWQAAIVIVVALWFRVWALDFRPAHFDEGVNGFLIDEMAARGFYEYRPENYHGPLHFYVLFAAQQLFGRSLWVLRMPTVLVGVATIVLMLAFRRWLTFRACLLAAAAAAVSPALVFYARDAIHETWLPFFILLAIYGGWGSATVPRRGDRWCLGLGLAGMVLTKETYLLHGIAAAITMAWVAVLQRRTGGRTVDLSSEEEPSASTPVSRPEKFAIVLRSSMPESGRIVAWSCVGLVIAFYAGFGLHWRGVAGLWETWAPMFFKGYATGTQSEDAHHKELFYYVKLMGYYEWPALAGLVIAPALALAPARWLEPRSLLRWLALFALGSLAGYSLVAYKTPWCLLAVLPLLFFLLGWAVDRLYRVMGEGAWEKGVMTLLVSALMAQPTLAAWRLNFQHPTDDGRRYVYVQTTHDIEKLLGPIRALVKLDPMHRYLQGEIFGEGHPLVWELADFPFIRFYEEDQVMEEYEADLLLVPESRQEEIEGRLRGLYFKEPYLPRDYGTPSWLYLAVNRFSPLFPEREPEFHPRVRLEATP